MPIFKKLKFLKLRLLQDLNKWQSERAMPVTYSGWQRMPAKLQQFWHYLEGIQYLSCSLIPGVILSCCLQFVQLRGVPIRINWQHEFLRRKTCFWVTKVVSCRLHLAHFRWYWRKRAISHHPSQSLSKTVHFYSVYAANYRRNAM